MAGGRLSLEDRRAIAAGLVKHLAYAEIARRIGRPTSTVSREVARNGHRGYDADRAQQAARRGARKGVTARRADLVEGNRQAFVEELAAVLVGTGMPRMASLVFASLITSETDSMTAADLVHELAVSPASVSKAIGYLEGIELVERHSEPGSRRERYRVGDDVWTRTIRADSSSHASVADAAHRGLALFGTDSPAGIRLARMGLFFSNLTEQLRGNDPADPTIGDAMAVIAALGQTQRHIAPQQLATALRWPTERLNDAIQQLRQRPTLADPFTVEENIAGYRLRARPDRLSSDQRAALKQASTPTDDERAGHQ